MSDLRTEAPRPTAEATVPAYLLDPRGQPMPERDPQSDPDLVMCPARWGDGNVLTDHVCAEFGPHETHRCCCGDEEPTDG